MIRSDVEISLYNVGPLDSELNIPCVQNALLKIQKMQILLPQDENMTFSIQINFMSQ